MPRIVTYRRIVFAGAMLCAMWLGCASAFAADQSKGDPQAGRSLVYTCGGCHGVTGYYNAYPNYHVPRIGGQNYQYIVDALTEYKKGERSHPTMRAQGRSLSIQEIHDIAAYLSSLRK